MEELAEANAQVWKAILLQELMDIVRVRDQIFDPQNW
jgi:hypothetical protein